MTLTEFLLARIAEDGSQARDYWDDGDDGPGTWLGWIKAECEAKRRIVARHAACEDVSYGDSSTCPDLRDLATIWSDHPDYREEWRP